MKWRFCLLILLLPQCCDALRNAVEDFLLPGRRGSQQDDGARGSQQDDGARGSQQDDGARRWCRRGRNKMVLMLKDQDLDLDTMS